MLQSLHPPSHGTHVLLTGTNPSGHVVWQLLLTKNKLPSHDVQFVVVIEHYLHVWSHFVATPLMLTYPEGVATRHEEFEGKNT